MLKRKLEILNPYIIADNKYINDINMHMVYSFDLEDFKYNDVNMTAFRLVDADNVNVQKHLNEMETLSPLGAAILNRSQVMPHLIRDDDWNIVLI